MNRKKNAVLLLVFTVPVLELANPHAALYCFCELLCIYVNYEKKNKLGWLDHMMMQNGTETEIK